MVLHPAARAHNHSLFLFAALGLKVKTLSTQRVDVNRTESPLSLRGKRLISGNGVFGSASHCCFAACLYCFNIA